MKRRLIIIALAIVAAVLLTLTGLFILSVDSEQHKPLCKIENADTLYNAAASAADSAPDAVLKVSKTLETVLNSDYFLESSKQTRSYTGMGTENVRIDMYEILSFNDHKVSIEEQFANNTGYVTIENCNFMSSISTEEYLARFTPAVLMNAQLYETVNGYDTGSNYLIRFQHPTAPEYWSLKEDNKFIEATGTAYVSYDGVLTGSIYSVLYSSGDAISLLTVTVNLDLTTPVIALPEDNSAYRPIDHLDGPRNLERASGYLLQADNIQSVYTDSIYFQAFGDERKETKNLHTFINDGWNASVDSNITLTNDSRIGQITEHTQSEKFTQDEYSVSIDGAAPTADPSVTESAMRTYCRDLLLGTVMLPRYISGAELSETENTLRVTFAANEAFAQQVASTACQTLYQEPEMLNELAQKNATDTLHAYLELDKATGLPLGSGISYSGTYTIEALPYQLHFQADQTYTILKQAIDSETAGA